ncbi:hypothetical protein G6O67_000513 [Ophiocordyceps sinensis]|uniref:Uncharacterized protein n=2 Tax=Ophiocordyceps sinensis TaxID=72228 RepID=A0A8H4V9U2_9HYPO|nr:hypothetical protein G6O67_000513 [Ophiocordyceps sinensis]
MEENSQRPTPGSASTRPEGSLLLRLPMEMRDMIYTQFFHSNLFTMIKKHTSCHGMERIFFMRNRLALLRSCRQVYLEIGKSWVEKVMFFFDYPRAMLYTLANIPFEALSMIRHVCVYEAIPMWRLIREQIFDERLLYGIPCALGRLPELKLDRLTIKGERATEICHDTLDFLVKHSDGWKEIHYICCHFDFLAYKHNWSARDGDGAADRFLRVPQPVDWLADLEKRHGSGSGVSVAIYRSTEQCRPGSVMRAATRVTFTRRTPRGQDATSSGNDEVLVVVKRDHHQEIDVRDNWAWMEIKSGHDKSVHKAIVCSHVQVKFPGLTWLEMEQDKAMVCADDFKEYYDDFEEDSDDFEEDYDDFEEYSDNFKEYSDDFEEYFDKSKRWARIYAGRWVGEPASDQVDDLTPEHYRQAQLV